MGAGTPAPSCWRDGWCSAGDLVPAARDGGTLGPGRRHGRRAGARPAGAARPTARRARGLACVVVDDASADAGATKEIAERHGARFVGLATNVGPAARTQRGVGRRRQRPRRVRRLRLRARPTGGSSPLLGHFDDPLVAAVAPRIVSGPGPRTGALARVRGGALVARPGRPRRGRSGPAARIPFVPSAALLVRADVATGPDLFDAALRGGEDVDLVWRAGRGRMGRPLRTRRAPSPTTGRRCTGVVPDRAGLSTAPRRRRWPGATATRWRPSTCPAGRWPCGPSRWPAGPCWRWPHSPRPSPCSPTACAGWCATPWRWRRRSRDAARPAPPCPPSGRLTRAWSPGARARAGLSPNPRRVGAGASRSRAQRLGRRPEALDPVRFTALHVADDVAYGAGVWAGCARERTLVPLVPRISWRAGSWSVTHAARRAAPATAKV